MHVAMIFIKPVFLGAVALLKEKEDQLEGTVRLIFLASRRNSEGASDVLATGLLRMFKELLVFTTFLS